MPPPGGSLAAAREEPVGCDVVNPEGEGQAFETACASVVRSVQSLYRHRLSRLRREEVRRILAWDQLTGGDTALEVGTGDGFQLPALRARFKLAIGADRTSRTYGGDRRRFIECAAEALPFKAGSFDLIYTSNLLEHLADRDQGIQQMKALLRRGGMMIHAVPTCCWKLASVLLYPVGALLLGLRVTREAWRVARGTEKGSLRTLNALRRVCGIVATAGASYDDRRREGPAEARATPSRHTDRGVTARIVGMMLPAVHGTYRNHLEEFLHFRRQAWRRLFERHHLRVVEEINLGCYTEYGLLGDRLGGVRELLLRCGLSSCIAYCVRLDPESCQTGPIIGQSLPRPF